MNTILFSLAQAAADGPPQPNPLATFLPLVFLMVIFYFLLIRPQQKRAREHQQAIAAVKKGDEVVTGGGIRGKVTKVTEDEAEVEIAQGVRVRVVKGMLSQVLGKNAKPAND